MQVAVLGGGYAGVGLVRELENRLPRATEIVLVDEDGTHLIQHELHRLLRFPQLRDDLRIPLEDLVRRATVRTARVDSIDLDSPTVHLEDDSHLNPSFLAICLGAVTADELVPGASEFAQPLKRIEHARAIRERFRSLEDGDRTVVAGAGLSGIQVAGELAANRDERSEEIEIVLIEQAETVAPTFPHQFRNAVTETLLEAGITLRTDCAVARVTDAGVEFRDGGKIESSQVIWTGGITGPEAMRRRRIPVRSDLRIGHRAFALGDVAVVTDDHGTRVPPAAQTAVRQAPVAARNLVRLCTAERDSDLVFEPRLTRYVHESPGWVVSIGDEAVANIGEEIIRGAAAKAVKESVNAGYLGSIGEIQRALHTISETIDWPHPKFHGRHDHHESMR